MPATTTTLVVQLTVVPPESDTTPSVGSVEIVTEQALEESGTSDSDDGVPAGLIATEQASRSRWPLSFTYVWGLLAGTAPEC